MLINKILDLYHENMSKKIVRIIVQSWINSGTDCLGFGFDFDLIFHFRLNFIVYPDFKIQVHKMTQKVCEHFNKLINMNDPSYFNCSYSYSLL